MPLPREPHYVMTPALQEGRVLDALHDVNCAMEALNYMLDDSMRAAPECLSGTIAEGVYELFEMQRRVINGIARSVEELVSDRENLRSALGQREDIAPEQWVQETNDLRTRLIADQAKAGVNVNRIAAVFNTNSPSVERVIAQLEGTDRKPGRRPAASA